MWHDIEEYPGYEVSDSGRIRNKKTFYILLDRAGKVRTSINGNDITIDIAELVARYFLAEPRKKYVCHKDGQKWHNEVDNLYYSDIPEEQDFMGRWSDEW